MDRIIIEGKAHSWGAGIGATRHLYPLEEDCPYAACHRAYSGDGGVNRNSKKKQCSFCLKIEAKNG